MEIKTMHDYVKYLSSVSDAELLVRCKESNYARHYGKFEKGTFCAEMFNDIMKNESSARYLTILLDMCMSVSFELLDRVSFGIFDGDVYKKYTEEDIK